MLSAEGRSRRAKIAALTRWSREDPGPATAKARRGFDARFERDVDEDAAVRGELLTTDERARRIAASRKAYMLRLSHASAKGTIPRRESMNAPEEAKLTAAEQAAFDRVVEMFAPVTVGSFEPYGPDNPRPTLSVVEEADVVLGEDDDGFRLVALDWSRIIAEGVPDDDLILAPYLPRAMAVWAFGPAEGGKSLYFAWAAAELSRQGRKVVIASKENPFAVDVDRMLRLGPDFDHLEFYNGQGLDLADHAHLIELARAGFGADLIVIDTLSAAWSGDENDNAAITAFDRERLRPLIRLSGATVVVIHHTGHPQAFVNRGGAGAGRGASAMGQKADVVLVFQPTGVHEFTIDHAKNRAPGGHKEPRARYRIVDTDSGGLDLERGDDPQGDGLTITQRRVLDVLGAENEAASIKEIAVASEISRTTVQRACEDLARSGLVAVTRPGNGLANKWWKC